MSRTASVSVNKPDNDIWLACGLCNRSTCHKVVTLTAWSDSSPDGDIHIWKNFMTVSCHGCKTLSFCIEETCTEDVDFDTETGEQSLAKRHVMYPSRATGRPEMESLHEVPFGIYSVYRETHIALCSGQSILAGIGIRAIVEAVCNERDAVGRSLEKQIDDLLTKKIVTEDGAIILHSLRFMGNSAAHEVKAHTAEELNIAFGVVEYLLHGVYVMPKQAAKLPRRIVPGI